MARSVKSVSINALTAASKPSKATGVSDLILELELSEPIRLTSALACRSSLAASVERLWWTATGRQENPWAP